VAKKKLREEGPEQEEGGKRVEKAIQPYTRHNIKTS
jgi:hypothetical protein